MNVVAAAPAAAQPKAVTKAGSSASALKSHQAYQKALAVAALKALQVARAKLLLSSLKKASKASARGVSKPKASAAAKPKPTDLKPKVKKTPSAYILFCTAKRPEVKTNHPEATFGELGGLLGKMWTAMDATAKAPYEQLALAKKSEQQQLQPQPAPAQ